MGSNLYEFKKSLIIIFFPGLAAIFILGLLAVPFALVGVNSYFAADIENNVALVNDESITLTAFNSSYQNFRQRMASLMGESFDAAYFDDPVVRRQHLESMIDQEILRPAANRFDLHPGQFPVDDSCDRPAQATLAYDHARDR